VRRKLDADRARPPVANTNLESQRLTARAEQPHAGAIEERRLARRRCSRFETRGIAEDL
jgi:hypothetical protein